MPGLPQRAPGVMSNHGAFLVKEHRLLAQMAGNNCADCHQQSFCLDCHKGGGIDPDLRRSLSRRGEYMPRSHRSDFISIHSIKAADNPQNCYRCHESNFCRTATARSGQKGSMQHQVAPQGRHLADLQLEFGSRRGGAAEPAVLRDLPSGCRCVHPVPQQREGESASPQLAGHQKRYRDDSKGTDM